MNPRTASHLDQRTYVKSLAFAAALPRVFAVGKLGLRPSASKRSHCRQQVCAIMASTAAGLSKILKDNSYRAILLDQFGVLHDGSTPYPPVAHALSSLHELNVEILVLSNSSRRSAHASSKLGKMFPDVPPLNVITSGELGRDMFWAPDSTRNPLSAARAVVHFNWVGRGSISPQDNNLPPLTTDVSEADAMVLHGTEGLSTPSRDGEEAVQAMPWEELVQMVRTFAETKPDAPFVIVNPDVVTVDGESLRNMPGKLGLEYESAGGRGALRVGKPGRPAYVEALARLAAKGIRQDEVVAIGDSVAHDVLGAQRAGVASIYIAGGIDGRRFGLKSGAGEAAKSVGDRIEFEMDWSVWDAVVMEDAPGCLRPTHTLDYFRW